MEHILTWLKLKSVPGVGNILFKRLIASFQNPENVFKASEEQLLSVDGISGRLARTILNHKITDTVKTEMDIAVKHGFRIINLNDAAYPVLLKQIPDPPPILYVNGRIPLEGLFIGMVGTRRPTQYGLEITRELCQDLSARGITIVSGMARGIDSAAHEGVLVGNGVTIAVLGSGLLNIYPPENRSLAKTIARQGAVISELPFNAKPLMHHFPLRNRIISGMSYGIVVVEAGWKSGALITAFLAAEQNREVFAVPGSIRSFKSRGTHHLIKSGAKLVERADDIIEEILPAAQRIKSREQVQTIGSSGRKLLPKISNDETMIFEALGAYPTHVDDLCCKTKMETGKLLSILSQLEIKGVVSQLPGKYFVLNSQLQ